jgi:hypothetical protein
MFWNKKKKVEVVAENHELSIEIEFKDKDRFTDRILFPSKESAMVVFNNWNQQLSNWTESLTLEINDRSQNFYYYLNINKFKSEVKHISCWLQKEGIDGL